MQQLDILKMHALFANIRTLLHDDLALFIHVIIQQNLTMK